MPHKAPKNQALEQAIIAMGGVTKAAAQMGKYERWMYRVRRDGGIRDTVDLAQFLELAHRAGCTSLRMEDLIPAPHGDCLNDAGGGI